MKWRARWPVSFPVKWTAPTRWSRAFCNSPGPCRCAWSRPTWPDRLAALGQLSAGLAHELRNPLGTIKASAEMLSAQVSAENEVAREMAGFISCEVDRTNSLVTRFLQFARPLQVRLEQADLA